MNKLTLCALVALAAPLLSAASGPPTYSKDIRPLLNTQCAGCHRPGEVAPFSLLTYQDAAKRAALIATVTKNRYMPPWKPEPGFGSFQHERRLTDQQIALISEWVKAGAPEGNPIDAQPAPVFSDGWQAGKPDRILQAGTGFTVPADGPDRFRCFVLSLNLEQDSYLQTVEFRPGNRRVVHHGVIYVDETGAARKLAANSPDGSYPCFGSPGIPSSNIIAGWAPGSVITAGDPQLSVPLKKGTDLVLQIHYHPSGKAETDTSSVGLTFSGPPARGRTTLVMLNANLDIPAGEPHYVAKAAITLPRDVEISDIFPHAHLLGKEMKIDAHLPTGDTQHLIWIKDWDFNWQGDYRYQKPLQLPKGTRIELEYSFDNSAANVRNPSNPPARVRFGEETTDEMAVALFTVSLPSPADVAPFQRDMRLALIEDAIKSGDMRGLRGIPGMGGGGGGARGGAGGGPAGAANAGGRGGGAAGGGGAAAFQQLLQQFDKNGDGRLDDEERAALMDFLRSVMK